MSRMIASRLSERRLRSLVFLLVTWCLGAWSAGCSAGDGVPEAVKKSQQSHAQSKVIALRDAKTSDTLQDFCVNRDGLVLALLAKPMVLGSPALARKHVSQVRVLDRDGNLVREWTVDFQAQAINSGADGSVYLGGNGHLARYDGDGKLLAEGDAPQIALLANEDELREHAQEQLEAQKVGNEEQIKQMEQILEDPKKLEELEKQYEAIIAEQQKNNPDKNFGKIDVKKMYENSLKHLRARKDQTVDEVMASIRSRIHTVNAIAAGGDDVFVACSMSKGFGYAVWRTDRDFKNPKQIISGLSGCCGQMDIQTADDQVFVAENSRHRVVRYDRNGKKLDSFGRTDREGVGDGFSGCCNPMNLCFAADGGLLASESNGVVKRFTRDGKFESLVGIAKVPEGCKNSAIGISSDGDRVYYIDIQGSNLIILARNDGGSSAKD